MAWSGSYYRAPKTLLDFNASANPPIKIRKTKQIPTKPANQKPATSHQQPATSNQPPATSHQQPASSHQPPVKL
jgi:hypothetical protein